MNEISQQERQWAMFGHLSSLLGAVVPLASVIAPLVIWQIKKEDMPFAANEAKESLNFQISILIYAAISVVLMLVFIGVLLLMAVGLLAVIMPIIAGIKANEGAVYRYPLTIRFIK